MLILGSCTSFLEDLAFELRLDGWVMFGHVNVKERVGERHIPEKEPLGSKGRAGQQKDS